MRESSIPLWATTAPSWRQLHPSTPSSKTKPTSTPTSRHKQMASTPRLKEGLPFIWSMLIFFNVRIFYSLKIHCFHSEEKGIFCVKFAKSTFLKFWVMIFLTCMLSFVSLLFIFFITDHVFSLLMFDFLNFNFDYQKQKRCNFL